MSAVFIELHELHYKNNLNFCNGKHLRTDNTNNSNWNFKMFGRLR